MKKGEQSSKTKNPPANSGDVGSIPGLGRKWQPTSVAWRIPWTEKPGRLLSMGSHNLGSLFFFMPPFYEKKSYLHAELQSDLLYKIV